MASNMKKTFKQILYFIESDITPRAELACIAFTDHFLYPSNMYRNYDFNNCDKYLYGLLKEYHDDPFGFLFKFEAEIMYYRADVYISLFKFIKMLFEAKEKVRAPREYKRFNIDYYSQNVYNLLSCDEDCQLDNLTYLVEEMSDNFYQETKFSDISSSLSATHWQDLENLCKNCEDVVARAKRLRNPTLLERLRLFLTYKYDVRRGFLPYHKFWHCYRESTIWFELMDSEEETFDNIVSPQMDEAQACNVMSPTSKLPSTQSGSICFNESYISLKDIGRRYQLYWEGTVNLRTNHNLNEAILQFPALPAGLSLDINNPDTSIWNALREGAIPLIASGFRFFRGGLRFRIVFPPLDTNIWIQHHPDKPFMDYVVATGMNIASADRFRNHNYGFYIQSLRVNNIVEVEVPFYQPGTYGILSPVKPEISKTDLGDYLSLGDIVIGLQNNVHNISSINISIYYSLADDMSFHVFQGFPPVVHCDEMFVVNPQMEDARGAPEQMLQSGNVVLGETQTENTGTTAAVLPFYWWKLSTSEPAPNYDYIIGRFYFFGHYTWRINSEANKMNGILDDFKLPSRLFSDEERAKSTPSLLPFFIHQYWRGDMEVRIQINSNKFQIGQLQVSFRYLDDYLPERAKNTGIFGNSQLPHVLVDAGATNEAVLYIPYKHFRPFLHTKKRQKYVDPLYLGTLMMRVMHPLTVDRNNKGPQSADISLFIRFINSEFSGLRDVSIVTPQMDRIGMMLANTVIDKVIGDKNCDNQSDMHPPSFLVPTASHSWCVGNGMREPVHPLTLCKNENGTGRPSEVGVNELDLSNICHIYGMMDTFVWDSSNSDRNVAGTILWNTDVHPMCDKASLVPMVTTPGELLRRVVPPVGVVSSMYQYWRGGLEYRFDIICSQFHTGRLLVAYIPGAHDATSVTLDQAKNSSHVVFSLNEAKSFSFVVPYIADKPWWFRKYAGPQRRAEFSAPSRIYMFVLNQLVPMENVSPIVRIFPYIRAASDFELAVPVQPSLGLGLLPLNIIPERDYIRPKPGYAPIYAGNWREMANSTAYIYRYGSVTDHVVQFLVPELKLKPGDLVYGKIRKPGTARPIKTTLDVVQKIGKDDSVTWVEEPRGIFSGFPQKMFLWYSAGYIYGIPFSAPDDHKDLYEVVDALRHNRLNDLVVRKFLLTYMADGDYLDADTSFTPIILKDPRERRIDDNNDVNSFEIVQPQMFSTMAQSLAGHGLGSAAAWLVGGGVKKAKQASLETLHNEIDRVVKPQVTKILKATAEVKDGVEHSAKEVMEQIGWSVLMTNLMHILANPSPCTVAISVASILGTILKAGYDFITEITSSVTCIFSSYWPQFKGEQVVFAQSEGEDLTHPLISLLFTGVCALLGTTKVSKPNGYFNLMRDVNMTTTLSNNVIVFLRNCSGVIDYYVKYVMSYINPKAQLDIMLEKAVPDIKIWFEECDYLLNPQLTTRLYYESLLVTRVFDACVVGSILVSSGLDQHYPGAKVVFDTYRDICKLRATLVERGVHPGVRFECFPIWIYGPPGIGKSYLTTDFCGRLRDCINLRSNSPLIYYLEPGKKYWTGIADHPFIVRDDAYQVSGTLQEEELAAHFAICSSATLNPPMAKVEQKDKLINPKGYIMLSNAGFPNVSAVNCPEAMYRRRKLLIQADYADHIQDKYKTSLLDAGQLTDVERSNFGHLKFRLARDPKDVNTTFTSWMTYEELMRICTKKFSDHYIKEQQNFRKRMIDMYGLNENLDVDYIMTDLPNLQEQMSLQEKIALYKQSIQEKLAQYNESNEPTIVQEYIEKFKSMCFFFQQEDPVAGCSFYPEDYFECRVKSLLLHDPMSHNFAKTLIEEDIRLKGCRSDGELQEEVRDRFLNMGLSQVTIEMMFDSFVGTIDPFALRHCFLHACKDGVRGLKIGLGQLDEFACVQPLYFANIDVSNLFYNIQWGNHSHDRPTYIANISNSEEQLLEYLRNVLYWNYQLSYVQEIKEYWDFPEYGDDEHMKNAFKKIKKESNFCDFDSLSTEQLAEIRLNYLMFVSMRRDRGCSHLKWWYSALFDMKNVAYCPTRKLFFKKSALGMQESIGECHCENSITATSFVKHLLGLNYMNMCNKDIQLGLKSPYPVRNPQNFVIVESRKRFLEVVQDKVKCWWYHYVSPFVGKLLEFLLNWFPVILHALLNMMLAYGVAKGFQAVHDWISGPSFEKTFPQGSPNYFKFDKAYSSPKRTDSIGQRTFSQAGQVQKCQFRDKLESNMAVLRAEWIIDGTRYTRDARCLFIKERLLLILLHYYEEFKDLNERCKDVKFMIRFNVSNKPSVKVINWDDFVASINWVKLGNGQQSNYGLAQLPKEFPLFKSIVKNIATFEQHKNIGSVGDFYAMGNNSEFGIKMEIGRNYYMQSESNSSALWMDLVYKYHKQKKGFCGSVLVDPNLGQGNGAIIGIHVAGNPMTNVGTAEPLYREMFEVFKPEREDPAVMVMPLESLEESIVELDSNLMLYGCVKSKYMHKESGKTKIIPSPIHGQVYPVMTEPNPLRPGDRRQPEGSHPLKDGCNKLGSGNIIPFNAELVERVFEDEYEEQICVNRPVRAQVQPLTLQQAACGDPNVPYFEAIEWNTSEGFPISAHRPPGAHNKKWLFDLKLEENGYKLLSVKPELDVQLRLRDQCFKKNIKPPTIYTDCLKDYRLSPEKCKIPGKTRIFSVAPIQCALDFKMYMNDWCASIKQNRIKNGIAIGINPDSLEWTQLYNYLTEVGSKVITLDYTNFGPTLMSQLVAKFCDIIPRWFEHYGASEEHTARVKWLLECDILNPVHLCSNVVYQTLNGISSGSPLTGEANSVPNKCYIKISYLAIMQEKEPKYANMADFHKFVRLVVYGDDLIMTVADDIIDYFNAVTIRDFLWKHGIVVTSAAKGEELLPYTTFNEATFLKRGFKLHPTRPNVWLAPLDKQSIEECINWIKEDHNPIEALKACMISSLDMAYGQGREYYTLHRAKLLKALADLHEQMPMKTWLEKDVEIFDSAELVGDLKIGLPWFYQKEEIE